MNLLDFPTELLLQIVTELDDVFEFMRLASVCKKLQSLIKSTVLVISDAPNTSELFKSIHNHHVQLVLPSAVNQKEKWKTIFEKYQYFIFEYSSIEIGCILAHYICLIADLKSKASQKIDIVYLNKNAAELTKPTLFDRGTSLAQGQVAKTIFAYDSDLPFNARDIYEMADATEALMLIGNTYYFDNVEHLPQLYIFANPRYHFKIMSPTLKSVRGITNVNDKLPRLPTLFNFLQSSYIPNLQVLTGIGIESGMDLRVFERFKNLSILHLDSVFTGNLALNVEESKLVVLPNLETFKISGNSISISDLSFPKLKIFDITITGSTERNFRSTLHMENIQTPTLKELYISSSNVPDAPVYILKHLSIATVTILCIYSSNYSSFPKLEQVHFARLEEVKLAAFNVSSDEFFPVSFKLDAPNLRLLNVKNLQSYNQVLFGDDICYPGLKSLYLHLKVLPEPQRYEFTREKFPDLETLDIGYFNKFGRLVPNNIDLYLDLPKLKKVITKQAIWDKLHSTIDLKNGDVDLEIITTPGMFT